jgi:hypothetical protein
VISRLCPALTLARYRLVWWLSSRTPTDVMRACYHVCYHKGVPAVRARLTRRHHEVTVAPALVALQWGFRRRRDTGAGSTAGRLSEVLRGTHRVQDRSPPARRRRAAGDIPVDRLVDGARPVEADAEASAVAAVSGVAAASRNWRTIPTTGSGSTTTSGRNRSRVPSRDPRGWLRRRRPKLLG